MNIKDRIPLTDVQSPQEDFIPKDSTESRTAKSSQIVHISESIVKAIGFSANIFWLFFGGGLPLGLLWLFQALLCGLTIIGIPVAVGCWRIGMFVLCPIGREPLNKSTLQESLNPFVALAIIIWLPLGVVMAVMHSLLGLLLCASVVGIPFGIAHFKIARVAFCPYYMEIVSHDIAVTIRNLAAVHKLDFNNKYAHLSKWQRNRLAKWAAAPQGMKVAHAIMLLVLVVSLGGITSQVVKSHIKASDVENRIRSYEKRIAESNGPVAGGIGFGGGKAFIVGSREHLGPDKDRYNRQTRQLMLLGLPLALLLVLEIWLAIVDLRFFFQHRACIEERSAELSSEKDAMRRLMRSLL